MSLPCCVCLHQLPQRFRSSAQQNRKPQLDLSSSFLLEWPRCCYVAHSSLPTDIQHTGLQKGADSNLFHTFYATSGGGAAGELSRRAPPVSHRLTALRAAKPRDMSKLQTPLRGERPA